MPFIGETSIRTGAAGAGGADLGDDPGQSAMFDSASSTTITTTFGSAATNTKKYSIAFMMRVTAFGATRGIVSGEATISDFESLFLNSSDQLEWQVQVNGGSSYGRRSTMLFRDPGWYHILFTVDTTVPESIMYVNGVEIATSTIYSGEIPLNTDLEMFDNGTPLTIGEFSGGYFNGLLCDLCLGDGQVWTPSDFGHFSTTHPDVWVYDNYSGAFGDNGRRLQFATNTNFGDDTSGNASDLTANNMGTDHQVSDTPTDNLTALSALGPNAGTLSNGGKVHSGSSSWTRSTLAIPVAGGGIWYFEAVTTFTGGFSFGFIGSDNADTDPNSTGTDIVTYVDNNRKNVDGTVSSYGSGFSSGHRIGCELDLDNNEVRFYNNAGTSLGTISKTWTSPAVQFVVRTNTDTIVCDFDDADWSHTPTAGALALRQANLPNVVTDLGGVDLPNEHFNTILWQGNASIRSITGVGFQPDLLWIKDRDNAANFSNSITDAVRGVTKHIYTDSTRAELTSTGSQDITSFDSDGFSLAAVNTNILHNASGVDYVGWNFLANGAGAANSDGTISSTVSVSSTGAWSMGTYVGTGALGTIGHGLPGAPDMIIVKNLDQGDDWCVYHIGTASDPETDITYLNLSLATQDSHFFWNDTAPTSSVFTINTGVAVNTLNENYFFIAFRSVPGICKVGSHIGNGSADGPYIDCGFAPAFIMSKSVGVGSWIMLDRARPGYNPTGNYLYADLTNAEAGVGGEYIDMLSSGIKIRTTGAGINSSSVKYIDLIIAESAIGGGIPFPNAR